MQNLAHIDPERVKNLLLEIDYHHLLKQPEVKVLFDGTELTVQHIESRTAAYQKLRESWNKSKAVKELKADLKELEATSSQLSTTNLIPSPLPDLKSQFNQKLIKHLQHLLHIDPERVKYLLLEIDYHHLLKQPEVKVLFDGTELTVQHIESRTAAYQKLRESWNKSKAVKELKADLKELEATSSQLSTTNLIPSPLPDLKSQFNQKLIKHLQHLLHIDPERVKYLLLEIDYHHLQ